MTLIYVDIDWAASAPTLKALPGDVLDLEKGRKVIGLRDVAGDVAGVKAWLAALFKKDTIERVAFSSELHQFDGAALFELAEFTKSQAIDCSVDLVVPEDLDVAAWYSRRDGQVGQLLDSTNALRRAQVAVRWVLPMSASLIYRLETIVGLALAEGVKPVLVPQSVWYPEREAIEANDHLFVWDFLHYSILGERAEHFQQNELVAYRKLRDQSLQAAAGDIAALAGANWRSWTHDGLTNMTRAGAGIGAAVLAGGGSKEGPEGLASKLRTAIADLVEVGGIGLSAHMRSRIVGTDRRPAKDEQMPFVVLIGAYGGEHIGDAAILGGVLERIHARHGTKKAILMTQRLTHTKHLMPMLDVPVELEVWDYSYANISRAMSMVDGVVYAGGPLTDIPKHLVRHLETATRAKRLGKPFVMEGIGPHWFPRWGSRVTARRLVETADFITIRVSDDAKYDVVKDIDFEIGHDPAFDYLKTREPALTRFPDFERPQLEALLEGVDGRPLVGINIRPIGHLYAEPPAGLSKKEFTAQVVDRFERELAQAINDYVEDSGTDPCFIFFPMNAIQFGMSDLKSAWRIMRHLKPGVDVRMWQADASLDGVVDLLRKMDVVIAMRFHAAIFALSQGCDVIGIDYVIGKKDKVNAVLTDAGKGENVCRIDDMRAPWLVDKLSEALGK